MMLLLRCMLYGVDECDEEMILSCCDDRGSERFEAAFGVVVVCCRFIARCLRVSTRGNVQLLCDNLSR